MPHRRRTDACGGSAMMAPRRPSTLARWRTPVHEPGRTARRAKPPLMRPPLEGLMTLLLMRRSLWIASAVGIAAPIARIRRILRVGNPVLAESGYAPRSGHLRKFGPVLPDNILHAGRYTEIEAAPLCGAVATARFRNRNNEYA